MLINLLDTIILQNYKGAVFTIAAGASRVLNPVLKRQEISLVSMTFFYNLHCSPNIIRIIKSRRMRWEKHIARTWDKRNA
jgi:hypothetical protein